MPSAQTSIFLFILFTTIHEHNFLVTSLSLSQNKKEAAAAVDDVAAIYQISKQLCTNCFGEAIQFLFAQNLERAAKFEPPLLWDSQLEEYAKWWARERQADCSLIHSFPEGDFKLGENIYWGSGSTWTPSPIDAVKAWVGEEKYYTYNTNSCALGHQCGHYTQIVWKKTSRVGCARVICETGDVFMTCNYYPPGNYIGEKPY